MSLLARFKDDRYNSLPLQAVPMLMGKSCNPSLVADDPDVNPGGILPAKTTAKLRLTVSGMPLTIPHTKSRQKVNPDTSGLIG